MIGVKFRKCIRTLLRLIVAVLAVSLLVSCCCTGGTEKATAPDAPSENAATVPKNAAVLFSSLAEAWVEAGGEISITVGETVERGIASPGVKLVDNGAGKTINTEALLAYSPDVVIVSADIPAQVEVAKLCAMAGIPTLELRIESFTDYLYALDRMTELTGNTAAYDNGLKLKSEIDGILESPQIKALDRPEILFVRAGSTDASTKAKRGSDHFACAMLEEMGCVNVLDKAPILADGLNMEAMIAADPDYIFFSIMGDETSARAHIDAILSDDIWQTLTAVREGRTYILPKELFHFKPNARWGEAYRYLADLLTGEHGA